MINLRTAPLHEIVEDRLATAIYIPGLQHIRTRPIGDCDGGGEIDFLVGNQSCGVKLIVNSDGSYVLIGPDEPKAVSWTAEQAQPETIKAAVIEALRARVRAAA
jgi:hypothetical protein